MKLSRHHLPSDNRIGVSYRISILNFLTAPQKTLYFQGSALDSYVQLDAVLNADNVAPAKRTSFENFNKVCLPFPKATKSV